MMMMMMMMSFIFELEYLIIFLQMPNSDKNWQASCPKVVTQLRDKFSLACLRRCNWILGLSALAHPSARPASTTSRMYDAHGA